ncbi:uncharacterized protein LOC144175821 isoform X2 [Haemaphysalis longicornis]
MMDKHNVEHEFFRYDDTSSEGFRVPARKKSTKVPFYGIFLGAEVQSHGAVKNDIVANVRGKTRLLRKTDDGKLYYNNSDKVDESFKYIKKACGGNYYRDHMPAIASPGHDPKDLELFRKNWKTMSPGDTVQVIKAAEQLERLQSTNPHSVLVALRCGLGYGLPKTSALHAACDSAKEDLAMMLVVAGAEVDIPDENGDTAVHHAAGCEQSQILELLIDAGANMSARNTFNETALHVAIKENSVDCARVLAKNIKGSDINIQDNAGDTVLHSAINAGMRDIISVLLQHPRVNVAIKNYEGETPLHVAVAKANFRATQQILQIRTDIVHEKNKENVTALHMAVTKNLYDIVKTLLTQGRIAVDAVCGQGSRTALSLALEHGHKHVVKVLVDAGADVNKLDADGNTPLHICLMRHHYEIIKILVAAGADVNKQDAKGNTPLHICLMGHHCEIIEILVAAGADVNKQDAKGNTPLHISLMNRRAVKESELNPAVAPKLKAIATELRSIQQGEIDTSLALACFFISNGSSLKMKNSQGLTPLSIPDAMPVLRTLLKWAPKTSKPPAGKRSVGRTAEDGTAVAEGGASSSTESIGAQGPSDEQAHCSTAKEEQQQEEINDRLACAICMEKERTVAFLCGHGTCQECATKIQQCHVCRAPVEKIIKLYEG